MSLKKELYKKVMQTLTPVVSQRITESIIESAVCIDDEFDELIEDEYIADYKQKGWSLFKLPNNHYQFYREKDNLLTTEFKTIACEVYDDPDDMPWDMISDCVCIEQLDGSYNFIWLETGAVMLKTPIYSFEGGNEVLMGDAVGYLSYNCVEWEGGIGSWTEKVNFTDNPYAVKKKADKHQHGSFSIDSVVDKKTYREYELALIKNGCGRLQFVQMYNDGVPFSEDFDEVMDDYDLGDCEINGDSSEESCVCVRKNGKYNYISLETGATVIEYWLDSMIDDKYCECNGSECWVDGNYLVYEEGFGGKGIIEIDYKTNYFNKHRNAPFMSSDIKTKVQETLNFADSIDFHLTYEDALKLCEKNEQYTRIIDSLDIDFDNIKDSLNKIPYDIKKEWYIDFSKWVVEDITESEQVNYSSKHTFPILKTLDIMREKYRVYSNFNQLFGMWKKKNNIYVVCLIPEISMNVEMIIQDMEKLGYFVSKKVTIVDKDKMIWKEVEFEPYEPRNIYEEVQTYEGLFVAHVSPKTNYNEIINNGLVPSARNNLYQYPPRVYCFMGTVTVDEIKRMIKSLSKEKHLTCDFTLYYINLKGIDIKLYKDCQYEGGCFTYDVIPADCIMKHEDIPYSEYRRY